MNYRTMGSSAGDPHETAFAISEKTVSGAPVVVFHQRQFPIHRSNLALSS
jgi:hypothetical protein